jgi:alpha-beta hydrolase superfamily lysophospholipase
MRADRDGIASIPVDGVTLEGVLDVPSDATGVAAFAHGSGSSRKSARNDFVADVRAPTLLIVGGTDLAGLERIRTASERLAGETALRVVEGAGHLFEDEGELEAVADAAPDWFEQHRQ